LFKTIGQLKANGSTVFLITHRPGAISVADRLLILRDGQVVADGPRDAVIAALQKPKPVPAAAATVRPAPLPGADALPA